MNNFFCKSIVGILFLFISITIAIAKPAEIINSPNNSTTGYLSSLKPQDENLRILSEGAINSVEEPGREISSSTEEVNPVEEPSREISRSIVEINPVTEPSKVLTRVHPYLGFTVGTSIAKIGQDQRHGNTSGFASNFTDHYVPNDSYYAAILYGVHGGYEFKVGSNTLLGFGLGVYHSWNHFAKGNGYLEECLESPKDLFSYEYKFQNTRFMFETQLSLLYKTKVTPFVSLGIGPSINSANSYEERLFDINGAPRPMVIRSHTNVGMAYQVGAGISYLFSSDRDRVFVGYRHVNLGYAHFVDDSSTPSLDVSKVKTNEVYIGYTRSFNF